MSYMYAWVLDQMPLEVCVGLPKTAFTSLSELPMGKPGTLPLAALLDELFWFCRSDCGVSSTCGDRN